MKLAMSNIAWSPAEDDAIAALMPRHGFSGVEIAPTKYWPKPLAAGDDEIFTLRRFWESRGISVVAMQSLLFGTRDMAIFGTPAQRQATLEYLQGIIRLGAKLGAGVLVFGSPKNRLIGVLDGAEVEAIAIPFFRALGETAAAHRLRFCIEPNPAAYGCDWITNSAEGQAFVRRVNHPDFGLHLDAAALALAGEDAAAAVAAAGVICHFHASEANLAPIGAGTVDHRECAAALRKRGYENWVSIEMRATGDGGDPDRVAAAMTIIARAASGT